MSLKSDTANVIDYTDNSVQIVAACDSRFSKYLSVMLLSLFKSSANKKIQVTVIVASDFREFELVLSPIQEFRSSVRFVAMAGDALSGLKVWSRVTTAIYFRLFIGNLLDADIKRVIYLDCDLIIIKDISYLWNLELYGNIAGAVSDDYFERREVLGIRKDEPYFNSGVMLIDLERWRDERIGEQALDFATRFPERLTWGDQCALNWVLRNQWTKIDDRFNLQGVKLGRVLAGDFVFFRGVPTWAANTSVVHFTGVPNPAEGKPWFFMCDHPYKAEYLGYAKLTPWREEIDKDFTLLNIIRKIARRYWPNSERKIRQLRRHGLDSETKSES